MYLAPDHSPDIVISYSHGDGDGTGESELKAWSQRFAAAFESELRQEVEFHDVDLFLDESKRSEKALDRTLPLTEQLRQRLQGAGLLTILMSPQYLASEWCRAEREWWIEQRSKRGSTRGHLFVCRIWPTEADAWPQSLCDERGNPPLGFWFHGREQTLAAVRPYGWRGRSDDKNAFTEELLKLVGAVCHRMREFKRQLDMSRRMQQDAQRLLAVGGQALYLHARAEQREAWERSYASLAAGGFVVVPAEPEPRAENSQRLHEIAEERARQLVACDALLLLAGDNGIALDGDMLTVGRQSRNLARARSGKLLPCAVLGGASPGVESPQRRGLASSLGIDWINTATPDVTQKVQQWLTSSAERLDVAT